MPFQVNRGVRTIIGLESIVSSEELFIGDGVGKVPANLLANGSVLTRALGSIGRLLGKVFSMKTGVLVTTSFLHLSSLGNPSGLGVAGLLDKTSLLDRSNVSSHARSLLLCQFFGLLLVPQLLQLLGDKLAMKSLGLLFSLSLSLGLRSGIRRRLRSRRQLGLVKITRILLGDAVLLEDVCALGLGTLGVQLHLEPGCSLFGGAALLALDDTRGILGGSQARNFGGDGVGGSFGVDARSFRLGLSLGLLRSLACRKKLELLRKNTSAGLGAAVFLATAACAEAADVGVVLRLDLEGVSAAGARSGDLDGQAISLTVESDLRSRGVR